MSGNFFHPSTSHFFLSLSFRSHPLLFVSLILQSNDLEAINLNHADTLCWPILRCLPFQFFVIVLNVGSKTLETLGTRKLAPIYMSELTVLSGIDPNGCTFCTSLLPMARISMGKRQVRRPSTSGKLCG